MNLFMNNKNFNYYSKNKKKIKNSSLDLILHMSHQDLKKIKFFYNIITNQQ